MAYDDNGEWYDDYDSGQGSDSLFSANAQPEAPTSNGSGDTSGQQDSIAPPNSGGGFVPSGGGGGAQPAPLKGEDYFKEKLGDLYTPGAYESYRSHASEDPNGNWADRIINKENLRRDNEVGSEYHADNKGGYLTGPAKPSSKLLGGAPSAGGSAGGFSGSGDNSFQNEVYGYLKGLFPGGGFNQDIMNRRLDSVRTGLEGARKHSLANNEAYLADRGLLGSGPQAEAANSLESRLFGQFGSAYNDIYADESRNADNRMIAALQAATGMSEADAQRQVDWYRANTENALGFGNLAARNKEADQSFFLGNINAQTGQQNAATNSYTAQMNYDIATKQLAQAQRDYDEAVRVHDMEAADRAQQRINDAKAIIAGGTHR